MSEFKDTIQKSLDEILNRLQFNRLDDLKSSGYIYIANNYKCHGRIRIIADDTIFIISGDDIDLKEDFLFDMGTSDNFILGYSQSISGELIPSLQPLSSGKVYANLYSTNTQKILFKTLEPLDFVIIILSKNLFTRISSYQDKATNNDLPDLSNLIKGCYSNSKLVNVFNHIKNVRIQNPLAENFFWGSKIFEALSIIIEENTSNNSNAYFSNNIDSDQTAAFQVSNYIDKHLESDLNIELLAQIAYMSRAKLKYVFKNTFGVSMQDYIKRKRLVTAKQLLVETNLSIKDISTSIGYKNTGSFCEMFKKETSMRPLEYRKTNNM